MPDSPAALKIGKVYDAWCKYMNERGTFIITEFNYSATLLGTLYDVSSMAHYLKAYEVYGNMIEIYDQYGAVDFRFKNERIVNCYDENGWIICEIDFMDWPRPLKGYSCDTTFSL